MVVPTFERRASVLRLLGGLRQQTVEPTAYEVVVAIDGSQDGTREAVSAFDASFAVHSVFHANRGLAATRNAGLHAAAGEIVAFLDDDMEPTPTFVEGHLRAHAGEGPAGVIGAAPIVVEPGAPPLVGYMSEAFSARLERLARSPRVEFQDAYTGNFSMPRATLEQLGGYDEGFRLYGHEDYELVHRLASAGVRLVYAPLALAHQHYEKTFAAVARDAVERGRTAVYFSRKHPEVVGRLRLGAYASGTRKWRALRGALLSGTRVWPNLPRALVGLITSLERRRPRRLHRYYAMALDYCYWVGVQAARREDREAS